MECAEKRRIEELLYIKEPGPLQQNACIERRNGAFRCDWLNRHLLETFEKVHDYATRWLWKYNNKWLKMTMGGMIA